MESYESVAINIPLVQQQSITEAGLNLQLDQLYAALPLAGLRCTRVLDLEANKNPSAPLQGTLRVVDLQTSPHFTALSYVWGEPTSNKHTIACNNVDVPVTKSCYEALYALRHINNRQLTIWIDAICIHQGSNDEKKIHIPLMHEVFTWVQTVYIWLGPGNGSTDRAINWLSNTTKYQPHTPGIPWITRNRPRSRVFDLLRAGSGMILASLIHTYHIYRIPTYPDIGLRSEDLYSLLNREWHRRAWTFQEVVLASNPVVVCGTKAIDWAALFGGIYIWSNFLNPWDFLSRENLTHRQSSTRFLRPTSPLSVAWNQLFMTWLDAKRLIHWNNVKLRDLPNWEHEAWSIQAYHASLTRATHLLRVLKNLVWICLAVMFVPAPFIFGVINELRNGKTEADTVIAVFLALAALILLIFVTGPRLEKLALSLGRAVKDQHNTHGEGETLAPLLGILRALRERRASEAKDMSFAMHGILRRLDIPVSSPNYDKSLGLVYRELFEDLVRWRPALIDLLADVGPTIPGMPSWVPDWSTIKDRLWLESGLHYDITNIEDEDASTPNVSLFEDELVVSGVKIATVSYFSGPFEQVRIASIPTSGTQHTGDLCFASFDQSLRILMHWITLLRRDVPLLAAYDRVPDVAYRVLCGFSGQLGRRTALVFNDFFRVVVGCTSVLSSLDTTGVVSETTSRLVFDELKSMPPTLDLVAKLVNGMIGKRGLFLANGYAGSGPPHMAVGDEV